MRIIRIGDLAFNADQIVRATLEGPLDMKTLKLDTTRDAITLKYTGDTAKEIWNLLVTNADVINGGGGGGGKKKKSDSPTR